MGSTLSVMTAGLASLFLVSAGSPHAASHAQAPPNITGVWSAFAPTGPDGQPISRPPPPLTPAARAAQAEVAKVNAANHRIISESRTKCLPVGMPTLMSSPFGIEFLQTPGRITIISELSTLPRTIYLDEKTHPDSVTPGWNGHSIGHWEGATLVVDTIGFNGRVQNVSEKMHMIERIHLDKEGYLIDDMTLDDPVTYTQPYQVSYRYRRAQGAEAQEIMEYVCEVDPANLVAYEAEQKAAGRTSVFDPAWTAKGFNDPASVAAAAAGPKPPPASPPPASPAPAAARKGPDYASMQISDQDLGGNVHLLFGAGGNMGLLVTDQGMLLVDSEYPQLSDKIKAKLAALSAKPLRYLVDTHFHWDHVGGNAGLSATGATIIATPQTLHYVDESFRSATKRPGQFTFDPTMLPTLTTKGPMTIHLGGETVEINPIKPAHTDGDLMVRFVNADVIEAGDAVVKESYPLVDVAHGGSIDQLIAFCDDLYALATPKTRIIPGHGPLVDREYVKAYRAMLVTARDRVAKAIRAGKTLDQLVAAKPLADLDAQWEGTDERFKEADFLKQVYGDLSRSKKP